MRPIFDFLTRTALRFRAITLSIVLVVMLLGGVAASELQQELLPPVEFPQTFILAQVSGMTSDQVLNVITARMEEAILAIPEIVNIESQTSGAFGVFMIASNDFGLDQEALREDIQAAIDSVWLPTRAIRPPEGEDGQDFSARLLGDLTPDVMLFLAERDANFLFQLSPDVWALLPDDTVEALLAYLANRVVEISDDKSALERLIDQEVVPQLETIGVVANVQVSGGQVLPGEEDSALAASESDATVAQQNQLLQLSPDVWEVVSARFDGVGVLDESAVAFFQEVDIALPDDIPALPESWQMNRFSDASDLLEMRSFARSLAGVLNEFVRDGEIVGALGQTDDLTPEIVERMLDIDPTLVQYFDGEHLTAMAPDVFDALPAELELDGFTRDELAAASLARSITDTTVTPPPADLPSAWRIQPPQLITFSFADLPLATFSVFSTEAPAGAETEGTVEETPADGESAGTAANETTAGEDTTEQSESAPANDDVPVGPELPQLFTIFGEFFGAELETADDLIEFEVSGEIADTLGAETLRAADLLNALLLLNDFAAQTPAEGDGEEGAAPPIPGLDPASLDPAQVTEFLPALQECNIGLLSLQNPDFDFAGALIGCLDADVIGFLADNDPSFLTSLDPQVYNYFREDVLALEGVSPLLGDAWTTLSNRPEFADMPLRTADDLLALGDGSASAVLNVINEEVPERFSGYEIQLFDSLTPTLLGYFASNETDFYSNLAPEVLLKFSPEALAALPAEFMEGLDEPLVEQINAIATGETPSAAQQQADEYASDVLPARPDAPALNADWQPIAEFFGIELVNAYDFFRYPETIESPARFINNLFNSPQGEAFAPNLLGNMPADAFFYIAEEDPNFISNLIPRALQLLPQEIYDQLPQAARDRAESGEVFVPTTQVTRTSGSPSLLITVLKDADANTVEAFRVVEAVIEQINAANENIEVSVAFEQASFIEESISGVVISGVLGAFFAIVNILVFLSGDVWGRRGRRISGLVILGLSAAFLLGLFALNGFDTDVVFEGESILLFVLGIFGVAAGLVITFYWGRLPYPSWRSTLVIAVSIPLSILSALALMNWLPPFMNELLSPYSESPVVAFILQLFPESLTINIMTLSGLTVAVGRLVDDSIVVLENIFRQLQSGMEKREAVLYATRDVSVAIFSATSIAVIVFLPLGLTGGIIAEFFLPFGLAVTYTLASSFLTAITVIPALAYLLISADTVPQEQDTWMQRVYVPTLEWVLSSNATRIAVVVLAVLSVGLSGYLFGQRPATFLPDFGEPQITVNVTLPQGTSMLETDELVRQMETRIPEIVPEEETSIIRTSIGGGGLTLDALVGGGGGVSENVANIVVGVSSSDVLDRYLDDVRAAAEEIFGEEYVSVSGGTIASEGFGGFELVVSGADQAVLAEYNDEVIEVLEGLDGLANVTSNLAEVDADGPPTIIRIDGTSAVSYSGELETDDTINFTQQAVEAVRTQVDLPEGVTIGQGFTSELQTEGFASIFVAMGIALVIVVLILMLVFRSLVYWFAVIFSVIAAPVGAAIALTLTDRTLGISALIGLLMLLGLVVTNAIVLIDRVGSNRTERGMNLYDALVEAGGRRLRPILMTALTTIIGLLPLAFELSEGAIIAAELGTVVIGGIMSSTLLTLIVVPAAYYLFTPLHDFFAGLVGGNRNAAERMSK